MRHEVRPDTVIANPERLHRGRSGSIDGVGQVVIVISLIAILVVGAFI